MLEGTVFFANEPILRVTASLPQAQFVETRLVNILHFQSLIASKAARLVLAAPGKPLVDFGLRRAHGAEAGLLAARASYLAGFAGTATLLANKDFGIPVFGTMAHSFVQACDDEAAAFEAFARSWPDNLVLLIDTYDTEVAARKVVRLAGRLKAEGVIVRGVRLDSGDLIALSKSVRRILDEGGLADVTIFASGGLDEDALLSISAASAPIDGFGIGTSLTTSSDAPALDCAYKLQEYAGTPRRSAPRERPLGLAANKSGAISAPTAECRATSCRSRTKPQWRSRFCARSCARAGELLRREVSPNRETAPPAASRNCRNNYAV